MLVHSLSTNKDETLSLPGGDEVPFRLIRPDDVPALRRFHDRLSEKSIHLRFFGSLEELPEAKANYFAHVDGVDHLAFVALDPDDPGEIIALVRYDRGPRDEFDKDFRRLIETAAPAVDFGQEQPLSNELLFEWQGS